MDGLLFAAFVGMVGTNLFGINDLVAKLVEAGWEKSKVMTWKAREAWGTAAAPRLFAFACFAAVWFISTIVATLWIHADVLTPEEAARGLGTPLVLVWTAMAVGMPLMGARQLQLVRAKRPANVSVTKVVSLFVWFLFISTGLAVIHGIAVQSRALVLVAIAQYVLAEAVVGGYGKIVAGIFGFTVGTGEASAKLGLEQVLPILKGITSDNVSVKLSGFDILNQQALIAAGGKIWDSFRIPVRLFLAFVFALPFKWFAVPLASLAVPLGLINGAASTKTVDKEGKVLDRLRSFFDFLLKWQVVIYLLAFTSGALLEQPVVKGFIAQLGRMSDSSTAISHGDKAFLPYLMWYHSFFVLGAAIVIGLVLNAMLKSAKKSTWPGYAVIFAGLIVALIGWSGNVGVTDIDPEGVKLAEIEPTTSEEEIEISPVSQKPEETSITLFWTTDERADCELKIVDTRGHGHEKYRKNSSHKAKSDDRKSHSLRLRNLAPGWTLVGEIACRMKEGEHKGVATKTDKFNVSTLPVLTPAPSPSASPTGGIPTTHQKVSPGKSKNKKQDRSSEMTL